MTATTLSPAPVIDAIGAMGGVVVVEVMVTGSS
jgi:hypothetical protein